MQTINCFDVMGHSDTTEGRGPMIVVARFSNYDEAVKFVKSKSYAAWCVMGYQSTTDTRNIKESKFIIFDTIDEIEKQKTEELKLRALAKLSKEEREALGL